MDIQQFNTVGNNIVLSPLQVKKLRGAGITNQLHSSTPDKGLESVYVVKKQDIALHNKMFGEGGLGSGKSLEERFPNMTKQELEDRRRTQISNIQRGIRAKNRAGYNEEMRNLYKAMAKENRFKSGEPSKRFAISNKGEKLPYNNPNEWYEYRLEKAREANARYRLKKNKEKILNKLNSMVDKEVRELWKTQNKRPRGRPTSGAKKNVLTTDSEWYKKTFDKIKKEKETELQETGTIVKKGKKKADKLTEPLKPIIERGTKPLQEEPLPLNYDDFTPEEREAYKSGSKDMLKSEKDKKKKQEKKTPFTPTEGKKKAETYPDGFSDKQKKVLDYIRNINEKLDGSVKVDEKQAKYNADLIYGSKPFKAWASKNNIEI